MKRGCSAWVIARVAPVLIIFLFSQRFLVEGMTAGGTKE